MTSTVRRCAVLAALAALLGPLVARADDAPPVAPTPAKDDPSAPAKGASPIRATAWRDAATLERRLAEALAAVEIECGATFATRPTLVVATRDDVKKVLLVELEPVKEALGIGDSLSSVVDVLASALAAKYVLAEHRILVLPDNVETLAKALAEPALADEDSLRAVLAHECTHALDFPRHGWVAKRLLRTDVQSMRAFNAVVEGHAQVVARRVAASWGLTAAFDRFTTAITALPPGLPSYAVPMARALTADAEFAYVRGDAFLEAVRAEGGDAAVLAVLDDPPRSPRVVEHPSELLHPADGPAGLALEPAFSAIEALAAGSGWVRQAQPILEGMLRGQLADLPDALRVPALAEFEDARAFSAARASDGVLVNAVVMRFRTPTGAVAFVDADRAIMKRRDETMREGLVRIVSATYSDGVGTDGAFTGSVVVKEVRVGTEPIGATTVLLATGPFAVEVGFTRTRPVHRERLDALVAGLVAYATDPAHPVPAPIEGFELVGMSEKTAPEGAPPGPSETPTPAPDAPRTTPPEQPPSPDASPKADPPVR